MLVAPYRTVEIASKRTVNVRRYNKMILARKIRLASFVDAPIFRKGFHSHPVMIQQ